MNEEFDQTILEMNGINLEAGPWLLSHAKLGRIILAGHHYQHYTLNIAKSLNSLLLVVQEIHILAMFERIHYQLIG